jgi:site-specific DNA-methyltransferase (adenine-specific)
MDARAWQKFTLWWMAEAFRALRPAGYLLVFTDWRQLPGLTDLFQIAGFVWRGIVPWDKGPASKLPNLNYFRHQCEYVVWGTKGPLPADFTPGKRAMNGIVRANTPRPRFHPTEKPTCILAELLACVPAGGTVLDPFMGSGTTGIAATQTGLSFVGIERDARFHAIAERRIAAQAALPLTA